MQPEWLPCTGWRNHMNGLKGSQAHLDIRAHLPGLGTGNESWMLIYGPLCISRLFVKGTLTLGYCVNRALIGLEGLLPACWDL